MVRLYAGMLLYRTLRNLFHASLDPMRRSVGACGASVPDYNANSLAAGRDFPK
jgi:hypothetical protein